MAKKKNGKNGASAPALSVKTGALCEILDGATLRRDPHNEDNWGENSRCLNEFFPLMERLFGREELHLPIPVTMKSIITALVWIPKKKEYQGKATIRQQQILSEGFKVLRTGVNGQHVLASVTKHFGVAVAAI